MKVVTDYPPNYKQICKVLPTVKKNTGIIFTYGNVIYKPYGHSEVSKDLLVHEEYHHQQQGKDIDGWWEKYLADPKFRAQEELGAYQRQYRYARRHYAKRVAEPLLDRIANDFSGSMYGNIYTKEEALNLIKEGI